MRYAQVALALAVAFVLAGCNKPAEQAEPAAAAAPAVGTASAEVAAPVQAEPLVVSPAELASCTEGAVVKVRWDLQATHPEVTAVEVFTGPAGKETLFAAGGAPVGEAETGPWAAPGQTFILHDKANGAEIARAVVGGPECAPAPVAGAEGG